MALLVIEGLDGAGKSTQASLLKEYILGLGLVCEHLHFPQTDSPVYGELIARFLRGELGKIGDVNPYLVALLYAGDRFVAKPMLQEWLKDGKVILLDRYVYSNVAYQCAKLTEIKDQEKLSNWILDTEFGYFGLPKPDLNIFLDVPFSFTRNKLTERRDGSDRDYLSGQKDIHEADLNFQQRVRGIYLTLKDPAFVCLNCSGGIENMLPPESIFSSIIREIESRKIFTTKIE